VFVFSGFGIMYREKSGNPGNLLRCISAQAEPSRVAKEWIGCYVCLHDRVTGCDREKKIRPKCGPADFLSVLLRKFYCGKK
jgi:hypothetical protein